MVSSALGRIRIGVAGWSVPSAYRRAESSRRTLLEQYAEVFTAVEINTSFYRPHRFATYERWSASVPDQFRFAAKVPKLMTHELRLTGCRKEIEAFSGAVRGLRHKLGALLVQLPPSLAFDEAVARDFFQLLRAELAARIVCEPRNPGWFTAAADGVFSDLLVTRVSADPQPSGCKMLDPRPANFEYLRLHGAPQMYYSSYAAAHLKSLAAAIAARPPAHEIWCIFDNTASGAAWSNAAALQALLGELLSATHCGDRPRECRQTD